MSRCNMLCLTILATFVKSVRASDVDVCFVGYPMDTYCIERGRLLDNPSLKTLEYPQEHSVHCLVDVAACRAGGYELLLDPESGSSTYCRAYKLDDAGNDMLVSFARANGQCSSCDADSSEFYVKGLRVTVRGTISSDSGALPTLSVTSVQNASVGCPGGTLTVPDRANTDCSSGHLRPWTLAHGTFMLLSWGLILPSGVVVARLLRHRAGGLWFKYHRPAQMVGICIAFTGWVIALARFDVFSHGSGTSFIHGVLGLIVMSLGILQPINAFFRPHKEKNEPTSFWRRAWEVLHKSFGYLAVLLGLVTVAIGTTILITDTDQSTFMGMYIAALCVLVVLAIGIVVDKFKEGAKKRTDASGVEITKP